MGDFVTHPQHQIDQSPMSRGQWLAVAIAIFLNALDGYDAASISFAAPGITAEWKLGPGALGWVLSMELIGMGVGSLMFGNLADRFGRRPTILVCLVIMTIGMGGAIVADDVVQLLVVRLLTGLGIGGMMSALAAIVGEHSNARHRSLVLSLMVVGYPSGLVLGGIVARNLLLVSHWSSVFVFGAILTAIALPLAWFAIPESVSWLSRARPCGALERANAVLRRFGYLPVTNLGEIEQTGKLSNALLAILRPPLARTTILLTLAYLTHASCLYFVLKWIPSLVVKLGFSPSSGADVLVWTMCGAVASGPLFAVLANAISVRRATLVTLAGSAITVTLFTRVGADFSALIILGIIVGIFITAASIGFYSLLATAYPVELRATGTGFGIGIGRAGASIGPILGGILFAQHYALSDVGLIMSAGSALSIVFILALRPPSKRNG